MLWTSLQYIFCSLADLIRNLSLSTTEGTYTFSDGTSFTLTGGTIGTSDATWSTDFTAWKDGQPKDDVAKQEKQDCVKVRKNFLNFLCFDMNLPKFPDLGNICNKKRH